MTIREVRCHDVSVPLHTPFVTALRRTTTVDSLLVEVVDADDVVGVGEAPQVWAVTGDCLAGARACIEGPLTGLLVGRDPYDLHALSTDIRAAVVGNTGATAALDVALHDLVARRLGVPLPVLLGGSALRVPTDVTLSAGDADTLPEVARARIGEGFTTLKLKVGTDAAADVTRVLAVREAVGPDVVVRLDANQGWSAREAVRVISELEDASAFIELVEQPVRAADLDGLAWVTDRVRTPVMADESVFSIRDLITVIQRRAVDLVNVKLAKSGGIVPARTLLELARAHEMGTMVGSMMETHVGVGAAASVAAAFGTTAVSDLDAAWWAVAAPVVGGPSYEGGLLVLPDMPGLGLEIRR
ncbi:MAG: mandelate racemase/muconate lactonizing enzyme family protein [Nocardioidaceae bacterium]